MEDNMKRGKALAAGDLAPDFTLISTDGEAVHLYTAVESAQVVLFFYLKAFTPLCIREACSFQNELPAFDTAGALVLGISPDSAPVARQFKKTFRLSFPLLLDVAGTVREAFQVPRLMGFIPGRSTYVINRDRRIAGITHAHGGSQVHVQESLRFLQD